MNVTLFHNESENNKIQKVLIRIDSYPATHLEDMEMENPTVILSSSHVDMGLCNYMYIDVFDRYYFINKYTIMSGGRIAITGSIDVLFTYRVALLTSNVNVIRNEHVNITQTPDNYLPITSDRKIRVLRFPRALANADFNSDTKCFILTVAGGGI